MRWLLPSVAGVALAAFVVPSLVPAPAAAQLNRARGDELTFVEGEVAALARRYDALRAELAAGSLTRSPRIIAERFTEARYSYLVEDYERCALIFWSLLENDDLDGDRRRPEAEWFLAECLYRDGNYQSAKERFRVVVEQGSTHSFYGDSLLKLIELYGKTGDVDAFNSYYDRFVRHSQENTPSARRVRYEMARTLFSQNKLAEAQSIFAGFPLGSNYTPQARYHSGVILVEQGRRAQADADELRKRGMGTSADREEAVAKQKYQQAIVVFSEVETLPVSTEAHQQVRDLSRLAVARLHYEMGDIPSAVTFYARISSSSPVFADASYELIWASIEAAAQDDSGEQARRRLARALRAIEIHNLAFPEDVREPALRLLGGHVRVRMEEYEEAIESYKDTAERFRGTKDTVDQIVASGADPMIYFNQLVDVDFVAQADLMVPSEARRQASRNDRVAEAVAVSGDLYEQQRAIGAAKDLLALLEEALYGRGSVDLIQTYRLHRQQLSTADAAALQLRAALIDLETSALEGTLPSGSRGALDAVKASYQQARSDTSQLAAERQTLVDRTDHFTLQAQAVDGRLYDLELVTGELLELLGAIEEELGDRRNRGERTRQEELEIRDGLERERAALNEVLVTVVSLRRRLEPRVLTGKLAAAAAGTESELRSRAVGSVDSVEARLASLRASASGGQDLFRRIDMARDQLRRMAETSAQTRSILDRGEAAEIADIKREVEFQRRMVADLDGEGRTIARENEGVSGKIGRQAFIDVAEFYEDMLTRADMGVADVYWYRKEQTSQERVRLQREKVRRMKALKASFADVLEEEDGS